MIEWIVSSSILILLIIGIRFLLRGRIKLWVQYALWLLVAVRLLVPFSVAGSMFSIQNILPEERSESIVESMPITDQGSVNQNNNNQNSVNQNYTNQNNINRNSVNQNSFKENINNQSNLDQNVINQNGINQNDTEQNGIEQNTIDQNNILSNRMKQQLVTQQEQQRTSTNGYHSFRDINVTILHKLWLVGMIVMLLAFFLSNRAYLSRLKKNRIFYPYCESKIPVYLSDIVSTPCISGVLKPAIYLPKNIEKKSEVLSYVICHENVHYVHRDHVWSVLRVICLIIHWYNPFVWAAASLSKGDAELACDEGVLKRLEDSEGVYYGKTLIDLSVCIENKENWMNLAASMSGGKKHLKERLNFITKRPKMAIGTIVLLQLLITVSLIVTFTGKKTSSATVNVMGSEITDPVNQEGPAEEGKTEGSIAGADETPDTMENKNSNLSEVMSAYSNTGQLSDVTAQNPDTLGYYNYTGYLDECYGWTGYEAFLWQDYDWDGTIDRVYRESLYDEKNPESSVFCNYRIEFGNGDSIKIESMGAGIPKVEYCDLTGDGKNEIVFTLSYDFSTNPMAYGELIIFEKKQYGYEKMTLPEELYDQSENGKGTMGYLLKYAPRIRLHYKQSGEKELQLTSEELSGENEFRVTVPVSEELWSLGYDSYAGETLEQYAYDTVIQTADEQQAFLELHFGVFDKNSNDEIITTLRYEDGKLRLKKSRYIQHYVESVPVSLEEGKQYELQLYGEEELGSGIYHIKQMEVFYIHDNESVSIQTIDLQADSTRYWLDSSIQLASYDKKGGIMIEDFNFDGYDDFAIQGWITAGSNVPYFCYLWNKDCLAFLYESCLSNVGVDKENKLLVCGGNDGGGQYSTAYYGADDYGNLVFKRMVIEDYSKEKPETTDLSYVEDSYSVPVYELLDQGCYDSITAGSIVYQAKEALNELYEWSGTKVNTCYFTVTDYGAFYFGLSEKDILKSRDFYCRCYGEEAGFSDCIQNITVTSARRLWYSPVQLYHYPENYDSMSREEIVTWYFERAAIAKNEKVLTMEEVFDDNFMIQTDQGHYYEVFLDPVINEVSDIYGPYQGYPQH